MNLKVRLNYLAERKTLTKALLTEELKLLQLWHGKTKRLGQYKLQYLQLELQPDLKKGSKPEIDENITILKEQCLFEQL